MAAIQATLDRPVAEARDAVVRAATAQGWKFQPAQSLEDVLVLTKGMSLVSWGSKMTVQLRATAPASTHLTMITGETFSIADWGRGKRAVLQLIGAIGAREAVS
jgi:hypothetical protein